MENEFVENIIIGAGAAGLGLGRLFHGQKEFLILEAHSLPGGCAGYFSRGKFHFDVGATTVSGIAHQGPLLRMKELTGFDPDIIKVDPGIEIFMGDKKISRFEDPMDWARECEKIESSSLRDFTKKIYELNEFCWSLTQESALFPPKKMSDLMTLLGHRFTQKLSHLPLFLQSFESHFNLKQFGPEFRSLINEILLISTQSQAARVPAFVGVMGFSYPEDVWYPCGGMKHFFETLASPFKENIRYRTTVRSIKKQKEGYLLETSRGNFRCKNLFSTLPVWDTEALLGSISSKREKLREETWGALTAYYKIKLNSSSEGLYQQLHRSLSHAGSKSLFLSLSHPEDRLHAPEGFQTLTVSTHIKYEDYLKAISSGREERREMWSKELEEILKSHFSHRLLDLELVGFGDPDTFVKFTKRSQGSVGGLPHSLSRNILSYPKSGTLGAGIHQLGDTSFPGQGIVGVFQGAINLSERLFN